jgi:hypothetical protein
MASAFTGLMGKVYLGVASAEEAVNGCRKTSFFIVNKRIMFREYYFTTREF